MTQSASSSTGLPQRLNPRFEHGDAVDDIDAHDHDFGVGDRHGVVALQFNTHAPAPCGLCKGRFAVFVGLMR